ncbi:hypothetical protein Gotur_028409 [Gossypium turneri]
MSSWANGHPSPMWYMPRPSHFPMTMTPMITYRPSMREALMESPLATPSTFGTQHSYTHSPWVTQTPLRSLFYQGSTSTEGEPQQPHPIWKLNLERI